MTDNIVKLYCKGAAKDPDAVLEQAIGAYDNVLILGWNKDGDLDPRATTAMRSRDLLWLMEKFRNKLINGDYDA